jgi:type IV pilus assembly protein PilC
MPIFEYVARSHTGRDRTGALYAPNEDALYLQLREQDLFLLRAREKKKGRIPPDKLKLPPKQLLAFTIHMATFLEAGVPLMEALHSLARESHDVRYQTLIDGMLNRLSAGSSFSEGLAQYSRIFDTHYVQMVRTGEATGQLDERLKEMVAHLEWQQEIRAQVKQSSTYPALLIFLLLGVVILLMTFTLPKFTKLLLQFDVPLPLPTRMVIAISNAFLQYWFFLPLIFATPVGVWVLLSRHESGRLLLDRFKLIVPLLGDLNRKIALSRFSHHFSILHAAGIDTLTALDIVAKLAGNQVIAGVLRRVRQGVEAGETLSRRLRLSREFPPFVVQMLASGEETGNLDGTLKKVAIYYDREIPAAIKRAFTILEPLILVCMGGLVVFIALAILLPIYQFGTSINK